MGIDYGRGTTNVDTEAGIRFGVISGNEVSSGSWDDIASHGEDMDFAAFRQQVLNDLKNAVERVLDEHGLTSCNEVGDVFDAEAVVDEIQFDNYEGSGDCTRYDYQKDGYRIQTCGDGDWFVLKSPYYAKCDFCSPCAPGAGYLKSEGDVKAYCLGHDWFEDGKAPYEVYNVSDDTLVTE